MGSSVAAVVIVVVIMIAEIYFEVKIEKNINTQVCMYTKNNIKNAKGFHEIVHIISFHIKMHLTIHQPLKQYMQYDVSRSISKYWISAFIPFETDLKKKLIELQKEK